MACLAVVRLHRLSAMADRWLTPSFLMNHSGKCWVLRRSFRRDEGRVVMNKYKEAVIWTAVLQN